MATHFLNAALQYNDVDKLLRDWTTDRLLCQPGLVCRKCCPEPKPVNPPTITRQSRIQITKDLPAPMHLYFLLEGVTGLNEAQNLKTHVDTAKRKTRRKQEAKARLAVAAITNKIVSLKDEAPNLETHVDTAKMKKRRKQEAKAPDSVAAITKEIAAIKSSSENVKMQDEDNPPEEKVAKLSKGKSAKVPKQASHWKGWVIVKDEAVEEPVFEEPVFEEPVVEEKTDGKLRRSKQKSHHLSQIVEVNCLITPGYIMCMMWCKA
ncbi:hypothetical protein DFH28DRAFT_933034 [Melampsora americana]|nr:hypothetical protein DFH28DRAFT_933034 [Melampsora americana]